MHLAVQVMMPNPYSILSCVYDALPFHPTIYLSLYTYDTEGPPPGLYAPSSPGDDAQLLLDTPMCVMFARI
jgi:hypothetical protein